jgi:pimeloyl-ACP methyl ester carboxylesterase
VLRRLLQLFKLVAIALVAAWFLICLGLWTQQEKLLFFDVRPMPERLAQLVPIGIHHRAEAGWTGWLRDAGQGQGVVIYLGGNAEEVSYFAEEFRERIPKWHLLAPVYVESCPEGIGEACLKRTALAVDTDAAVRWPGLPHVVIGRSLGSGLAVHIAHHRPTVGAVLITPYDSLEQVASEQYSWAPVRWLMRHPLRAIDDARDQHTPSLFVVAAEDSLIRTPRSRALFDAWGGPKQWLLLDHVGHDDVDYAPTYWPAIQAFLTQNPPR